MCQVLGVSTSGYYAWAWSGGTLAASRVRTFIREDIAMSGYTIIDADTHVTETPDLWTSRAPASMRDRVPRVEKNADGSLAGC